MFNARRGTNRRRSACAPFVSHVTLFEKRGKALELILLRRDFLINVERLLSRNRAFLIGIRKDPSAPRGT